MVQETFLDENRELVSLLHGQRWTPDAGQSSTLVYTVDPHRDVRSRDFWFKLVEFLQQN